MVRLGHGLKPTLGLYLSHDAVKLSVHLGRERVGRWERVTSEFLEGCERVFVQHGETIRAKCLHHLREEINAKSGNMLNLRLADSEDGLRWFTGVRTYHPNQRHDFSVVAYYLAL